MDPFSVSSPETVLNCTDAELWKWYYKPAKSRAEAIDKKIKHGGDVFEPETKEEVEEAFSILKSLFPEKKEPR